MKISDVHDILRDEKWLARTPTGRSMTEYAVNAVEATLEDEKNWDMDAIKCKNCGIIVSGLLWVFTEIYGIGATLGMIIPSTTA